LVRRKLFQEFFRPFSQVMSYTHQGKLDIYLFKPFHREPVKPVVAFIWPKTASTSMGRLLRWYFPVSEVSRSRALAFSSFRRWLTSIILLPLALWHCPRMGQPSQRPA